MSGIPSILDSVTRCTLIQRGGEACIYAIETDKGRFILKWYSNSQFAVPVISKISHLHIPGCYHIQEFGTRDKTPYLVYDFIDGYSSATTLKMPVATALGLLRNVAQTLHSLAENGIHHGDLNPSNIILSTSKEIPLQTTLIDCGIVGPGTLAYAAPERIQGKSADTQSDLYSLGMILFRWLTGDELIKANQFEEYASKSANVEEKDVTGILYETNLFSAVELSALSPLWKTLLQSNPDNRAEDFEELDELLEIALASIDCGEVTLHSSLKSFAKALSEQKMEQKVPNKDFENQFSPLPYSKKAPLLKKNKLKFVFFGIFGFILVVIALLVVFGTKNPDIDATGDLLLKNSRKQESFATETESAETTSDSTPSILIEDVPTPATDDQP